MAYFISEIRLGLRFVYMVIMVIFESVYCVITEQVENCRFFSGKIFYGGRVVGWLVV